MKAVRSTRQVISSVHAIVGGALFGAGAIVFVMHFFFDHHAAVLALLITGGALALSGIIELTICAVFRKSFRREQAKLARLKTEGQRFLGEIMRIQRHLGVNLGRSFSVYAECSYENHEGKICLVKSSSFLHENENFYAFPHSNVTLNDSSNDRYVAWIYVNFRDPREYAVEIFTRAAEVQADYDYR